ncbi:class F sortase [Patescibacteria group bacterium]|nr:class F sortase [Patescibacteria group bacterium]
MFTGFQKTRAYSKRHYVLVMAFAIVLVVVWVAVPYIDRYVNDVNQEVATETIEPVVHNGEFARSAPVRLVIPSLGMDTTFVQPLGLLPDQTIGVPNSYTEVGWYSGGVSPGEVGPSVILGHVDSVDGPAIFYSLGQMEVGDEIEVTRADGTIAKFAVTRMERHPQSDFPTMDVYGPTDTAALRLVTCSGSFDKGAQRYSHNLIVFAELIKS